MIHLRPHHGLCIQQFVGRGYSEDFVKNMTELIGRLQSSPQQMIELCCRADDLCGSCPHRVENGCTSGQKVQQIIHAGKLGSVCRECEWLSLCLSFYKGKTD